MGGEGGGGEGSKIRGRREGRVGSIMGGRGIRWGRGGKGCNEGTEEI